MNKRVIPAIVSTIEALHNCADSNYPLLYITESVFQNNADTLREFAVKEGYTAGNFYGKNGVFLSKNIVSDSTEVVNHPLFIF